MITKPPLLPLPSGATTVGDWRESPNGTTMYRRFTSGTYEVFDWLTVHAGGMEIHQDGVTMVATRSVSISALPGTELAPEQALALARALNQAAQHVTSLEALDDLRAGER